MKRLLITKKIGEVDIWSDFCGSFDDILKNINSLKKYYHDKFPCKKGEEIFVDYECFYDDGTFVVNKKEWETDKEFNKRKKEQAKKNSKLKSKEKKLYEKLSKKYGKKQSC